LDSLDESPFHKRIKRLGFVTPGRSGETITQAAFVEALANLISKNPFDDRNLYLDGMTPHVHDDDLKRYPFRKMFIEEKDFSIADNIDNYFVAVRKKWPKAWKETGRQSGILPKTNAFRAFMRHLRENYNSLSKEHGEIVPVSAYFKLIDKIDLKDQDLTSRNFKPGSSGEAAFYKVLSGKVLPEELFED